MIYPVVFSLPETSLIFLTSGLGSALAAPLRLMILVWMIHRGKALGSSCPFYGSMTMKISY
jgi:hypothetical protein